MRKSLKVKENNNAIYDNLDYEHVAEIAENLMQGFLDGKYDEIVIMYNQFINAATQLVITEQFLPIKQFESGENDNLDYIFEPAKEEIVRI